MQVPDPLAVDSQTMLGKDGMEAAFTKEEARRRSVIRMIDKGLKSMVPCGWGVMEMVCGSADARPLQVKSKSKIMVLWYP